MLSAKQAQILAFGYTGYDALICDGAIRSGKTSLMAVAYVDWAMRNFTGQNFIICGKTVGSAKRNVVNPYLLMTAWHRRNGYAVKYSGYSQTMTVVKGNVENRFMVFGAKDRSSFQLVQGFTAAGALIDEVALCDRDCVNQCLARCSVDGSKFWFNCNPGPPDHWFRLEWILQTAEKNAYHLHFSLDDNPSLSEAIKERYRSMYSGVFRKRYIDGDWVQAEGLVYSGIEAEAVATEAEYIPGEVCWCSIDYGITNPFVAQLWVVRDGRALMLDEWSHDSRASGRRLTDSAIYQELERFLDGKNLEAILIDPSATSFKEEIASHGRFWFQDADNSVLDGIQECTTLLTEGQLFISPRCKTAVKELGLYLWDDKTGKDQVVKENDHAMDAMRYFVKTVGYELLRGW